MADVLVGAITTDGLWTLVQEEQRWTLVSDQFNYTRVEQAGMERQGKSRTVNTGIP
jgi:hypothetical protein